VKSGEYFIEALLGDEPFNQVIKSFTIIFTDDSTLHVVEEEEEKKNYVEPEIDNATKSSKKSKSNVNSDGSSSNKT